MVQTRPIRLHLETKKGCEVDIVGSLVYKRGEVVGFHGTITFGGKEGCPQGKLTFPVLGPDNTSDSPSPQPIKVDKKKISR